MNISVNEVFEPVTEHSVISSMVRVLHLIEAQDAVMVIALTEPPGKPYPLGLEELRLSRMTSMTALSVIEMRSGQLSSLS